MSRLKNAVRAVAFLFLMNSFPSIHGEEITKSSDEAVLMAGSIDVENALSPDVTTKVCKKHKKLSYYLYISDFVRSFIEIPTSNVILDSTTISSRYLAGRASIFDTKGRKVGTCSASFLCMQNQDGIYTDISNYLSVDNGLIVSWFTPTNLINLEVDSIVNSMVTKCLVRASTKIGFNPFYGEEFNLVVSSEEGKIFFKFTEI